MAVPGSHRGAALRFAGAMALAVVLIAGLVVGTRMVRDDGIRTALDDGTVVATLQTSGAHYSDELRARLRAARADPADAVAAKRAARMLIDEGRIAGDSRLVGAALGTLAPFLGGSDAEALYLAATARQYQHDFKGALGLLDEAIVLDPNDAGAILTRATINVVIGEFDAARSDCSRLGALRRIDLAIICQSIALSLTAQAPALYRRLEALVAQGGMLDPTLETYAVGLMGEIALQQGWAEKASDAFETVLARDPQAVRVRMMLADERLSAGDAGAALAVLEAAPPVDGVLLRRVLAAEQLGRAGVVREARAELDRRVRLNLELGLTSHAREEARYFLQVAPDPEKALERAVVNWRLQHEIEDAQLLIDAAVAAGRPDAAVPVARWIEENAVSVPTLRLPDAVRQAAR